jgi:apolipoprotein D and lipocalin family protein
MKAPSFANVPSPDRLAPDLDTRILEVEQRLIAREEKLRRGIDGLSLRAQHALGPWRRALPAIGLTLAVSFLGALAWGWKRRSPLARRGADAMARHAADSADQGGHGGIPWVRLVALGWPLLPSAWRARVSPATASTLAAVGLPLIEWLFHGRRAPPPSAMPSVDLGRFAGSWFVLAQLPRRFGALGAPHEGQRILHYAPRVDGHIDVSSTRVGAAAGEPEVRGLAQVVPGGAGAKLMLSLWPTWLQALSSAWTDHWILHVDEAYDEALVGSASRDQLFVLSRHPQLPPPRRAALLQRAREQGFRVDRLRFAGEG